MSARKRPTPPKPWEPLHFSHFSDATGRRAAIWGNGRYTVTVHEDVDDGSGRGGLTVLGIHTRTRSTVGAHDWRHFQRIKNELCGPEREGVELYPAESRLVDTANEYWMWVLPEGATFGIGFTEREIGSPDLPGGRMSDAPGARQRPFEKEART